MTQDEIIEMARQAGASADGRLWLMYSQDLEAFAKLVEAHTRGQMFKPDWDNYRQGLIDGAVSEREACAKVCDAVFDKHHYRADAIDCAIAIRARGEQQCCDKP